MSVWRSWYEWKVVPHCLIETSENVVIWAPSVGNGGKLLAMMNQIQTTKSSIPQNDIIIIAISIELFFISYINWVYFVYRPSWLFHALLFQSWKRFWTSSKFAPHFQFKMTSKIAPSALPCCFEYIYKYVSLVGWALVRQRPVFFLFQYDRITLRFCARI